MSNALRFGTYPCRLGDISFLQMDMARIEPNNRKTEYNKGGTVDRDAVVTAFAEPMARIRTPDFAGVLGGGSVVSPTVGYAWDTAGDPVTTSALIQCQRRADGGIFASTVGTAFVATNQKGFVCIEEISAQQDSQEPARIELMAYLLSADGVAPPFTSSISSLTGTPTFSGLWYLGPTWIGDPAGTPTWAKGVVGCTVRPGIEYQPGRFEGRAFAQVGSIIRRRPEIRLTFKDFTTYQTHWGATGAFGCEVLAAARINVYFQRGIHGGTRYDFDEEEHVRFTMTTGDLTPEDFSVEGQEDGTVSVTARLTGTIDHAVDTTIPEEA